MVASNRRDGILISKLMLQFGRADNIGEYQSQNGHPMSAFGLPLGDFLLVREARFPAGSLTAR
jgi:hypothetical protein